ncbi:hypothetical protein [Candidatus Parabeggiatoa sp. HSG14]|uniref:hypothetical protein n=1 Tax=Candidatus Parabeggiatoa sp. HSG14 TaxID=3055593 RepID=UPI0025A7B6F4|nr:hypothetical protein [Thiotrichales bacterium HSG14]
MKSLLFLILGILLISTANSYQPLHSTFPEILGPVYQYLSSLSGEILYAAGFLALTISIFSGLPSWLSILLFVGLTFGCGYYFGNADISFTIGNIIIL